MAWSDLLDPASEAYVIAASANPRVRVVAGPGTGKSFAMKRRVARLLEAGIDPGAFLQLPLRAWRQKTCTENWSEWASKTAID